MLRLDKYLADVGIGTRSEVKKLLKQGLVSVNNKIIKDSSIKVDPDNDIVTFDGKKLIYQKYHYYMLNKPAGCVSATKDGLSQTHNHRAPCLTRQYTVRRANTVDSYHNPDSLP